MLDEAGLSIMSSRNLMLKYLVFLPDENGSQWRVEAEGHDQTSL